MPLSPALAAWLRAQGHDAVHAAESGLDRASDVEIIAHANRERRTIITADLEYPRLLALAQGNEPSLILFRDGDWSDDLIARFQQLIQTLTQADVEQSIIVVDRDRVRRPRLPIRK
jgi:predicted nuclease of predicted toxin-antitoxin system